MSVLREMVCAVVDFAAIQVVVEPGTVDHGEFTAEFTQEGRQPVVDELVGARRILLQAAQDLFVDDPRGYLPHTRVRQIELTSSASFSATQVTFDAVAARPKHPLD